jgi:hypothetical protein
MAATAWRQLAAVATAAAALVVVVVGWRLATAARDDDLASFAS